MDFTSELKQHINLQYIFNKLKKKKTQWKFLHVAMTILCLMIMLVKISQDQKHIKDSQFDI